MSLLYTAGFDIRSAVYEDILINVAIPLDSKDFIITTAAAHNPASHEYSIVACSSPSVYNFAHIGIKTTEQRNSYTYQPKHTHPFADTWVDASLANLLQEVLNYAATAEGCTYTNFVVTFSVTTGKYTISYGTIFEHGSPNYLLGLPGIFTGYATYTSLAAASYCVLGTQDHISNVSDEYEPNSIASMSISDGGYVTGLARTVPVLYMDWDQTFETYEKTFSRNAVGTEPWVFQDLFEHCRTIWPFIVCTHDLDADHYPVFYLRDEGSSYKPKPDHPDYNGHWHISFKAILAGWI